MNKLVEIALSQYGIKEIKGKVDNPEVLKYFDELGFDGSKLKDETSWCSAFVNWCAMKAGLPYTGQLTARSWLKVGEIVPTPEFGDIVIYWRESPASWKGHVGIYIREENGWIYTLGGNQGDRVCIQAYPSKRKLAYRRLK